MFELPPFPPPGEMIDIGTHKLHILSQGEGSPVVVLDAGGTSNVQTWKKIQPEISKFTQVIAYDRSGLGWSERGTNPKSPEAVVTELHALLKTIGISDQLVLVGHSLGGHHVRLFAQSHPEMTAGLVFVDSYHEDDVSKIFDLIPSYREYIENAIKIFENLSQKKHHEIISHFTGREITAPNELTKDMQILFDRYRPSQISAALEELKSVFSEGYQTKINGKFGTLPLIVLTALKPPSYLNQEDGLRCIELEREVQKQLVDLSSSGKHILVKDAGHDLHNEQPEVVIDAIREVVEKVREQNIEK